MSNLKCGVCGTEFPAILERHYISRDLTKIGVLSALQSNDEAELYDSYDCPNCGSQIIAQPRKRRWVSIAPASDAESEEEDEIEEEEEEEAAKTNEEILDAVGYEAIAAYLGLTEKQMATIRQAKEQHTGLVILKGTVR